MCHRILDCFLVREFLLCYSSKRLDNCAFLLFKCYSPYTHHHFSQRLGAHTSMPIGGIAWKILSPIKKCWVMLHLLFLHLSLLDTISNEILTYLSLPHKCIINTEIHPFNIISFCRKSGKGAWVLFFIHLYLHVCYFRSY